MQNQRNCALEYLQIKFHHMFNSLAIAALIMLWMKSFQLQSWIFKELYSGKVLYEDEKTKPTKEPP